MIPTTDQPKLLWHSNSAWAPTGYGAQTALFAPRINETHDVGISSFYGLEGARLNWQDMTVYPGLGGDFGNASLPAHAAAHFGGDPRGGLILTLMDVWVLDPRIARSFNTCCWVPVDHEPAPPAVTQFFEHSGSIPIAMSRFGEKMLSAYDPLYVPHGCFDYDAPIAIDAGHQAKLGDIVTGSSEVDHVLGVDADGAVVDSKVLDRLTIPLLDSHALRIATETGREMIITRDNEVMTAGGWEAAGALKTTDYICTLDVEQVNGTRTKLDDGGAPHPAGALRACAEGRVAHDASGQECRGVEDTCGAPRSTAPSRGQLFEAVASAARVVGRRIGLPRWHHRRRGAHHGRTGSASQFAIPALLPTGRSDQPVRAPDRVDGRAGGMDHQGSETNQGRMGLGVPAGGCGPRSGRSLGSVAAVPRDQGGASDAGNSVLRDALSLPHGPASERDGDRNGGGSPRLESAPPGTYERVASIEEVRLETVYDLKTETGNFLVDGMLVHNCDTKVYRPIPKDEAKAFTEFPDDKYIVGMVAANKGNPSRKCFAEALTAFKAFHAAHPDSMLYLHTEMTGRFEGINLAHLIEALGMPDGSVFFPDQDRLLFHPFSHTAMANVYSSLDVLLSPSAGEGFGLPVIEAQACGVPAIVTDFSAQAEVCGAGWKVKYQPNWTPQESWQAIPDVQDVLDALKAAHRQDDRQKEAMSAAARKHAEGYDADVVLSKYFLPALEKVAERYADRVPVALKAAA